MYRPTTMHVHLLMEYTDGYNLKEVLRNSVLKEKYLALEQEKHMVCYQLTKAIAYLHGHSYSFKHRDIKPLNVLINQEQEL